MWKWFKWVMLVILIIFLGIGGYLYYRYFIWIKMDSELAKRANIALASGPTISDPQNDFLSKELLGKEIDLEEPYRFSYTDIKSLNIGMDDEYLFYKVNLWGKIPPKPSNINGDYTVSVGPRLFLMDKTGTIQVISAAEFGWMPKFHIFSLNTWYLTDPTGILWPEGDRMKYQKFDSKVYGGAGTDYIMGAFPLDKLNFNIGDQAYIAFTMEAGSEQHSHASVDHLGGTGKLEAFVTWAVGTKNYTIDHDFNYQGSAGIR